MSIASVPNIIPVLSGKGGVGKSSVTVQLALTLALRGHNVGVLDIDLTGPSIPRLFGIESAKIKQAPGGWLPVELHAAYSTENESRHIGALYCMSLGFLLRDRGDAVVWRGPKKTAMVKQLLSDVLWPKLSYLLIDTPPGTSDEHISLVTNLLDPARVDSSKTKLGAVIVTTPQAIATADVKKELTFCKKTRLPVLGVVENMAGYVCPCCGEVSNVFSKGGGEIMAREWGVHFLGSAPIDAEGWGMLVEDRKRPSYGSAEGKGNDEQSNGSSTNNDSTADTMTEMYTSCSLFTIFDGICSTIEDFRTTIPQESRS